MNAFCLSNIKRLCLLSIYAALSFSADGSYADSQSGLPEPPLAEIRIRIGNATEPNEIQQMEQLLSHLKGQPANEALTDTAEAILKKRAATVPQFADWEKGPARPYDLWFDPITNHSVHPR